MFSIKPGVEIRDLDLRMLEALPKIARVFEAFDLPTTVTSGRDGEHMNGSLHYVGRALDFRTWADSQGTQLQASVKEKICDEILREIGYDFDVIPERTHIHVELHV